MDSSPSPSLGLLEGDSELGTGLQSGVGPAAWPVHPVDPTAPLAAHSPSLSLLLLPPIQEAALLPSAGEPPTMEAQLQVPVWKAPS